MVLLLYLAEEEEKGWERVVGREKGEGGLRCAGWKGARRWYVCVMLGRLTLRGEGGGVVGE